MELRKELEPDSNIVGVVVCGTCYYVVVTYSKGLDVVMSVIVVVTCRSVCGGDSGGI